MQPALKESRECWQTFGGGGKHFAVCRGHGPVHKLRLCCQRILLCSCWRPFPTNAWPSIVPASRLLHLWQQVCPESLWQQKRVGPVCFQRLSWLLLQGAGTIIRDTEQLLLPQLSLSSALPQVAPLMFPGEAPCLWPSTALLSRDAVVFGCQLPPPDPQQWEC